MSALLITAAAAAAGFAPPHFTADQLRQLQQRYPASSLRDRSSAAAEIAAQVDPKGRIFNCTTAATHGHAELAAGICKLIEGTRIEPATIQGEPAYGVVHQLVRFFLPGDEAGDKIAALLQPSDMELEVNKLPDDKGRLRVTTDVVVSTEGKATACNPESGAPQAYGEVACRQVAGLTFGTLASADGRPVPYVRTVMFDFILASPPAAGG